MKPAHPSLALLMAIGLVTSQPAAWAHGERHDQVKVLQEQLPTNAPGKKAVMLTVSYAPGEASPAHQHPGAVMAYVLEGAVVSKLNDEQEKPTRRGNTGTKRQGPCTAFRAMPVRACRPSCWCGAWSIKASPSPSR